ncbi:MAG: hypothetical protein WCT04_12795 [Planctomycetota bacterium]
MIRKLKTVLVWMIVVWSSMAHAAQNGNAMAGADGSMWQASADCSLDMRDKEFVIVATKHDPFIVSTDVPEMVGPFVIEIRAKSTSSGIAQIYWTPKENKGAFGPARRVNFTIVHDAEWHDYSVRIEAPDLGRIRLDPSTAPGECRVAFIRIKDKSGAVVKEWTLGRGGPAIEFPNANGNAQIRAPYKDSEIVITTTSRLAGAIHSLTWRGQEFVDSHDHGRQLQSASNLDCGTPITGETYNPTEAGSRDDGAGPFSSSRLLAISATGPELKTTIQMAFWLKPGEKSGGNPAKNTTVLSNHPVSKRVHIGHKDMPNVIEYDTTFTLPNEHHTHAVLEALTGYMPTAFSVFQKRDSKTGEYAPITDGPGEQPCPLVFSTENGSHAMGIFAPVKQPRGPEKIGYGRFRFAPQHVVKWNCVFRLTDKTGIKPGDYAYSMFVVVGTLDDVKVSLDKLVKEFTE